MKKWFLILTAVILLLSPAAQAEDLSALTDGELIALYGNVQAEITRRGLPASQETDFEATAVRDRVTTFFTWWSVNNQDEMLAMCSSGWKSIPENPRTELFQILRNRTPLDLVIESAAPIAGESPDGFPYYLVTLTSLMDRNNGMDPMRYLFRILVRKEEDGFWYIDPSGLNDSEKAEEEFPAEAAAAPEGETAASVPETDPFHFETFGQVLDVTNREYTICSEYAAALIKQDGRYFRAVSFLDERAKELYAAYTKVWETENGEGAVEKGLALDACLVTLPVQYSEELFVEPLSREELDAMAGNTLEEVMSEPWELRMRGYPEDAEAGKDVVFPMVKGFCNYELVISEPYEVYAERLAADHYDPVTIMSLKNYLDLTVKCVNYTGVSHNTLDLQYQPDGTFRPDSEPFPEDYDYDLMVEIADHLAEVWKDGEPDQETKEAMITKLTEEHPEAADMIRQIVESFH